MTFPCRIRNLWKNGLSVPQLSLIASAYLVLSANGAFWKAVAEAAPFSGASALFHLSLFVIMTGAYALAFNILTVRFVGRGLMILLIAVAAGASYFMDMFEVHIDRSMLVNVMLTDRREADSLLIGVITIRNIMIFLIKSQIDPRIKPLFRLDISALYLTVKSLYHLKSGSWIF